ncbi:hypothetical protein LINSTU_105 [Mycobacterium phage LinStu]|uniref:Uncharacterized protein n=7 Tax=Bixzunavirus TaxID=680114 RepID=A0A1J0M9X1_9CAUD|nr:hypothetical protein DANDELION_112 [Mycobacterium phage Dandelion]YP_009014694.1 hypothetical protein LINSTU_105 [Mycobacterium phage LinStu]YP_009016567.1 hypothetical protein NAPPY_109 [Mycobacterium phage Nappy]YP_009216359.1 hypothetical protein ALICE_99 [Mycobacterium phage Alice]YP_009597696.1 hypothetical protein FDH18_gp202 [Mycobacterium phage Lukilu]AXN53925.1 hypothetical protein SEA_RABINOVISH_104 [Mycobacterium phage Rabinovish]AYD83572.1 hypothetical protein SEA_FUDGETART_105
MCNRRRIVTAREQFEMLQPWYREAAAHPEAHPDLHHSFATHGSVHTTGGRVLPQRTANSPTFQDPAGWTFHKSFEPSQHALQGARAYASLVGLPDPHSGHVDYLNARRTPDSVAKVAKAYDSLPDMDRSAVPHFQAMADEVAKQHDFMTNRLGIKTQSVDYDPYTDVHEMLHDINHNKTLKVMGTHVTGGHPLFSNKQNDMFRAVHDFFGHAATGRSFDRHGEQAAYLAHAQMFSPHALPALASETKGQNSSLIYNGQFGPQKIGIMSPEHYTDGLALHRPRMSSYRTAVGDPQWQNEVEKAVRETGGYTFRDRPGDGPQSGFMVALPGAEKIVPRDEFSGEDAARYRQEWDDRIREDPDRYQGGWDDVESGNFYHDVAKHYDDLWESGVAGRAENDEDAQHGIYHLDSDTTFSPLEVNYGGTPGYMMARRED